MIGKEQIKTEAIKLVNGERSAWEEGLCDITDKVRMKGRDVIRMCRKNYYGVFDSYDENMVWVPVTEQSVEDTVKQSDIDQKHLQFRGMNRKGQSEAHIVRALVQHRLGKKFFGEYLDEMIRSVAIDGTVVWKTWKGKNKEGQDDLMVRKVDILNFYIDPTASSIYETPAIIERVVMPINEFKNQPNFVDVADVQGDERVSVSERGGVGQTSGKVKMVEVFERWGLMPKYFVTGNEKDTELIEGRIVTSGRGEATRVHYIGKNTDNKKPYEEFWYTRVPGRWYGRGVAEKVLMLQMWANMVKNIHIARQRVTQLGLWKVKQNSGITPQMLKRLPVNGAITVKRMDDIEQLVVQEASPASYRDMDDITRWTQKITSAVEAISAENLSTSAPATTSVINDRNNKSTFTLIREGLGMGLQRWMDRHAAAIILSLYSTGDMVNIVGDEDAVRGLIERHVAKAAMKNLEKRRAGGSVPGEEELRVAMARAQEDFIQSGDIMLELQKNYKKGNVEAKFFVTNEEMDVSVRVQNILAMLPIAPEFKQSMVRTAFDLMGLPQPVAAAQQLPETGEAGRLNQPKNVKVEGDTAQNIGALAGSKVGKSLAGQPT